MIRLKTGSWFLSVTVYLAGLFLGALFCFLLMVRRVRVVFWERLPRWQEKMIIAANHPSLLEPFLLPALFFGEYFFRPAYGPWSAPDTDNFYRNWWWFWLRARAIPVDRSNARREFQALQAMGEVLRSGRRIIIFPEGGRTGKGSKFVLSVAGKKLRRLKRGIGWLVLKTDAVALPVWVEGTARFWKGVITIKIGHPIRFQSQSGTTSEVVTREIEKALLRLADE